MKTEPITRDRIDELLRLLPLFSKATQDLEPKRHGLEFDPKDRGVLTMPYPVYSPIIQEFFGLASRACWSDYNYHPAEAKTMIESDETIASASLDQIKTLLTFCVRGERFCDGHWYAMIRTGRICAILGRLQELRESVT